MQQATATTNISDVLEKDFGFLLFLSLLTDRSLRYNEECFMLCRMRLISRRCRDLIEVVWSNVEEVSGLAASLVLCKHTSLFNSFTGSKSFHFSPCRKFKLDLRKFPHLESLTTNPLIYGKHCKSSSLKSLTLCNDTKPIYNDILLENSQTLTTLTLNGNTDAFAVLIEMPLLTSLKITSCLVMNWLPILTNLTSLTIQIPRDFNKIDKFTNLTSLGITSTSSINPENLKPLTKLKRLALVAPFTQNNLIHHISVLTNLSNLVINSPLESEDLSFLSHLTKLNTLALGPELKPVNKLNVTTNITKLFLDCPHSIYTMALERYTNLTTLSLSQYYSDTKDLRLLTNLTKLSVDKNDIKDSEFLIFTSLRALTVRYNRFLSAKTITKLTRLRYLRLEKCPSVTDYAFLFSPNLSTIITDLQLTEGVRALLFEKCVFVTQK